jgi:hypothetical protein
MMWCVPSLTPPVIPGGRVAASAQPVLPAGGGLHADGWHDMHLHARVSEDEPPAG